MALSVRENTFPSAASDKGQPKEKKYWFNRDGRRPYKSTFFIASWYFPSNSPSKAMCW
jgi:hypothetical protein